MKIISIIRDITQILTEITSVHVLPISKVIKEIFNYLLYLGKHKILSIFKFQWLFNYSLLYLVKTNIPRCFAANIGEASLFDFNEVFQLGQNPLVLGILNSFFLTLPVSIVHFSAIRRLIISGIPAASYTLGGYIVGQILFYSCVIFGIRSLMIPWLTLEPLNYIFGLILVGRIIYSTRFESFVEIQTWDWRHPKYQNHFINSFLLAWCEQGTLFQYLSNLTFSANPTILQGFQSNHIILFFLDNFTYIMGLFLGSVIFTGFWMWFFLRVKKYIFDNYYLLRSKFINRLNNYIYLLTTTISLATIPYYAFAFVLLGPLGFVSEDSALNKITNCFSNFYINEASTELASIISIDPEVVEFKHFPFNRGSFLLFPETDRTLSLEDLAYGAEFAWVKRIENLSTSFVMGHHRGRSLSKRVGFRKIKAGPKRLTKASFARRKTSQTKTTKGKGRKVDVETIKRKLPTATKLITYRYMLNEGIESGRRADYVLYNYSLLSIIKSMPFIKKLPWRDFIEDGFLYNRYEESESVGLKRNRIIDRFTLWYDLQDRKQGDVVDSLSFLPRHALQSEHCFPPTFRTDQYALTEDYPELGMRLRQYYNNSLIYKILVALDITSFVNRLPKKYKLSGIQEFDLFVKRQILSEYYNSIRLYMDSNELLLSIFREFFGGSKNIVSQVYHQQFTGTLRNIDKYFSLRIDDVKRRRFIKDRFLKYIDYFNFGVFKGPWLKSYKFKGDVITLTKGYNAKEKSGLYFFKRNNGRGGGGSNEELKEPKPNFARVFLRKMTTWSPHPDSKDKDYVRRLMAAYGPEIPFPEIHPDDDERIDYEYLFPSFNEYDKVDRNKVVLSFDQPLYISSEWDVGPEPHEELYPYIITNHLEDSIEKLYSYKIKDKTRKTETTITRRESQNLSFADQICLPFYITWNRELNLRQVLFSNKVFRRNNQIIYLSHKFLKTATLDYANDYLSKIKEFVSGKTKRYLNGLKVIKDFNKRSAQGRRYYFTFGYWPMSNDVFTSETPDKSPIPYLVLKEEERKDKIVPEDDLSEDIFEASDNSGIPFIRKWLLENSREEGRDMRALLSIFVPQKGGYFWPGTRNKIKTEEDIDEVKKQIFDELNKIKNRFLWFLNKTEKNEISNKNKQQKKSKKASSKNKNRPPIEVPVMSKSERKGPKPPNDPTGPFPTFQ
uniref:conserved chloroplast protein Ycf1/TIC214 n=1 Tax=Prototheca miyajii TaxID=2034260 RepID=UPI003002C983